MLQCTIYSLSDVTINYLLFTIETERKEFTICPLISVKCSTVRILDIYDNDFDVWDFYKAFSKFFSPSKVPNSF